MSQSTVVVEDLRKKQQNLGQPPREDSMKSTLVIQGINHKQITLLVYYWLTHKLHSSQSAMRHNPGGSLALASRQFIIHKSCDEVLISFPV